MIALDQIRKRVPRGYLLHGQVQHAMLVVLLAAGATALLRDPGTELWGLSAMAWARLTIAIAIVHQVIVVLVWRLQLVFGVMTRLFGDKALRVWGAIFLPFLFARPLLLLAAGIADANSLGGNRELHLLVGAFLVIVAGWGAHSVIKYFTVPRALGGDHFYDKYLNMPLVRQGAFKYSSNAMYGIVFLGLWGIALLTNSWNALVLALFQHAYVWVHMYCTEDPDMRILYGENDIENT